MQTKLSALRNKYKAKPKPRSKPAKLSNAKTKPTVSSSPAKKPATKPSAAKLSYAQHMANLNKGLLEDSSEDSDDKRRKRLRMKKRRRGGGIGVKMVKYKTGKKVKSSLVKRMKLLEEMMTPDMVSPEDLEKKRRAKEAAARGKRKQPQK